MWRAWLSYLILLAVCMRIAWVGRHNRNMVVQCALVASAGLALTIIAVTS